jgi:hypothetical protein
MRAARFQGCVRQFVLIDIIFNNLFDTASDRRHFRRSTRRSGLLRAALGQADPGRGGFPRADVGGQLAEQGAERRQVCVGDAGS